MVESFLELLDRIRGVNKNSSDMIERSYQNQFLIKTLEMKRVGFKLGSSTESEN
jgi:hypothetical protein